MKTKTSILVQALEILARDIQSDDGVANAAIAEGAERIRELDAKLGRVSIALTDALSTFRHDDKTTIITSERQEAWRDALNS